MKKHLLSAVVFFVLMQVCNSGFAQTGTLEVAEKSPSCSGKPNPFNISTWPEYAVCKGKTITLKDTTTNNPAGITNQWQYAKDSTGVWANSVADTNKTFSKAVTESLFYRLVKTCTTTGDTTISNFTRIGLNDSFLCSYCSPFVGVELYTGGTFHVLKSISVGNTSFAWNSSITGQIFNSFTDYYTFYNPTPKTTATLKKGQSYQISTRIYIDPSFSGLKLGYTGVWFDWNRNGIYEVSEFFLITPDPEATGVYTISVKVPTTASVGAIGMRFRAGVLSSNACVDGGNGEAHDFIITIDGTAKNCSGKPNAGIAYALNAPYEICRRKSVALVDSALIYLDNGAHCQWQSSNNKGATWSDMVNDTGTNVTAVITDTLWFRNKATCDFSGDTAYSNIVKVNLKLDVICACAYCSPDNGNDLHLFDPWYEELIGFPSIDLISIPNTTLNNTSPPNTTTGYTYYPPLLNNTASLVQGVTYQLIIKTSAISRVGVWIDWNQNGKYETSEFIPTSSITTPYFSIPITVPLTSSTGLIGLRIREQDYYRQWVPNSPWYSFEVCAVKSSGETKEFAITILPPIPCSGKPNSSVAIAPVSICSGRTFDVVDTGYSNGYLGLHYLWQKSTNNGASWTNLVNDTLPKLSVSITDTTSFRYVTYCAYTKDTAYSNIVKTQLKPFLVCSYCSPDNGTELCSVSTFDTSSRISNLIDSVSITGTKLGFTPYTYSNLNGYYLFQAAGKTTDSLQKRAKYKLVAAVNKNQNITLFPMIVNYWIDWNMNGIYESTEKGQFTLIDTAGNYYYDTITVPTTIQSGLVGLRIRYNFDGSTIQACSMQDYVTGGATYDYIFPVLGCNSDSIGVSISTASTTVIIGSIATFNTTITNGGSTPKYQWKRNGVDIAGATSATYTTDSLANNDTITCKLTNSSSCLSNPIATSKPIVITLATSFAGKVINPVGNKIPFATLNVNGSNQATSDSLGNFNLALPIGGSYTIKPSKNNDIIRSNGVSLIDLLRMQAHVLNKVQLNSPFKIIAADVNSDGSISTLDILYGKRFILHIDSSFVGNREWVFIDSAYLFPDSLHPFPYKDSISFTNLTTNKTNQTFYGIKLGDVTWDWNPAVFGAGIKTKPIELYYNNQSTISPSTNEVRIPIRVNNFKEILGMQYTLGFNSKAWQLKSIENNKLNLDYGITHAQEGKISFLWTDAQLQAQTLPDSSLLMELVFTPIGDITKETLTINSSLTPIEAWDANYQPHNIILQTGKLASNNLIVSNANPESLHIYPNPTEGLINLQLALKESKQVLLQLTNAQGKQVFTQTIQATKGISNNAINLHAQGKLAKGVYYLKGIGVEGNIVKKVVVQ